MQRLVIILQHVFMNKKYRLILYLLALIAIFSPSFYFYNKLRSAEKLLTNFRALSDDPKAILTRVSELTALPQGEEPTIATITDVERARSQPFFAKAKNGDKVLMFPQSRKAILYDPIANKIIEMGPLVIPTPTEKLEINFPSPDSSTPSATHPVKTTK